MVMKTTSLFQLGGITVLLSAILTGIGNVIYFASGQSFQPTTLHVWRGIFAGAFFVLGIGALLHGDLNGVVFWDWSAMFSLCWLKCILSGVMQSPWEWQRE